MKSTSICVLVLTLGLSLVAQAPPAQHTTLKVGDTAPDFTLLDGDRKPVKLSDFHGKSVVVLAFFPAAFSGGCTKEMAAYQLNLSKFEGADTQVFGISMDNTFSNKEFAKSLNVTFKILSDFSTRQAAKDYGVLNEKLGMANRTTFVINKEGKIEYIEEGSAAIDVANTAAACDRLAHKAK
jgi:peroxiredoxin